MKYISNPGMNQRDTTNAISFVLIFGMFLLVLVALFAMWDRAAKVTTDDSALQRAVIRELIERAK